MVLEAIDSMIQRARAAGYTVGYFEAWNLESLQGIVDAAEEASAPVLLGFNGDFLSRPGRAAEERLAYYAALGLAAAEAAVVPCGLVFNECPCDEWIERAIDAGFNLVMPADPSASYSDYVRRVTALTRSAHTRAVAVEAELGELPCGASGQVNGNGSMTDPARAADFVNATGVDLLAVSVGNVHICLHGKHGLDLDRLAKIRAQVSAPLVLHGGTGIADDALREAIALGVAKVNYGTCLKQRYLRAVRAALRQQPASPHALLGLGGAEDVLVAGRLAVREAVLERIGALGCCGQAPKKTRGKPASSYLAVKG